MDSTVNMFDPSVGLLKTGCVMGYDPNTGLMAVQITETRAIQGSRPQPIQVPVPYSLAYNNGLFIGSLPAKYSTVIIGQGAGGQYYFVSFFNQDITNTPTLNLGELLIQSTDDSKITLDLDNNITLGSDYNNIHLQTESSGNLKSNYITFNFENENHLTQGNRSVSGVVKRDLTIFDQFDADTKYENDNYDPFYTVIGLDPSTTANDVAVGPIKNPPFVEHRDLVYEFQLQSDVSDDVSESLKYTSSPPAPIIYTAPNRRNSRADTLSLSLVEPNYLMESVKGTVIDIFGNILDMNRVAIPVGASATTTINPTTSTNQQQSFLAIKSLERNSLAYHFEINARKDPNPPLPVPTPLDINADNYNAKLQRSRFHFDIDKEGMFKLNVPASSETGSIPLLARYENYSTFGTDDNGNVNKLWFRDDNTDIFLDSFASPSYVGTDFNTDLTPNPGRGSIALMNAGANAGPIDRISGVHIQHGTPYHDILTTCLLQQNTADSLAYITGEVLNPINLGYIQNLTDIVSDTIQVGGTGLPTAGGPNAGGRSGSINCDGAIDVSLGANTVDRQSLWLDTAGGIVSNIGRDINQRSMIMNANGDIIIQIGGFGVSGDARFTQLGQDGAYNAVLDLRVYNNNFAHMFRIDSTGINIISPGSINIHASQGLKLSSDSNIQIDAATVIIQGRGVLKETGGSI